MQKIISNFYLNPTLLLPICLLIGQVAVSLSMIIITIYALFYFKEINLKHFEVLFLFLFFLLFLYSTYLNYGIGYNFLKSTLFFKFFFLYILSFHSRFFINFFSSYYKIFLAIFFISLFVIFDCYYQYFNPKKLDLFGFLGFSGTDGRLTGPFGSGEAIPGSYLLKISLVPITFIFLSLIKKNKNFLINIVILILIYPIIIFLTGERMSFLMLMGTFFIFSFLILFFNKLYIKYIIYFFASFFLIIILIISNNPFLKHRYNILYQFLTSKEYLSIDVSKTNKYDETRKNKINFFNNQWGAHYLLSIEIWQDHLFFGGGAKSFRTECGKKKYENIKSLAYYKRCNTHPHNIYLELLSETGIFGLSLFLLFIVFLYRRIFLILKKIKLSLNELNNKNIIFYTFLMSISLLTMLLWPIRSSGSLFANFNGSMIWYNFFLVSLFCNYFKKNNMI